jgi:hypothetical protein
MKTFLIKCCLNENFFVPLYSQKEKQIVITLKHYNYEQL